MRKFIDLDNDIMFKSIHHKTQKYNTNINIFSSNNLLNKLKQNTYTQPHKTNIFQIFTNKQKSSDTNMLQDYYRQLFMPTSFCGSNSYFIKLLFGEWNHLIIILRYKFKKNQVIFCSRYYVFFVCLESFSVVFCYYFFLMEELKSITSSGNPEIGFRVWF